jgi:hypothetical protein
MMYKSWLFRLILPLLIYICPLMFNLIIFDQNELQNGYRGIFAYLTISATFIYSIRKQQHRISHISG